MLFTAQPSYNNFAPLMVLGQNNEEIIVPRAAHGQMICLTYGLDQQFTGAIIGVGMPNSCVFQLHVHHADQFVTQLRDRMLSDAELLECQHHLMYAAIACYEDARLYGHLALYKTRRDCVLGKLLPIYTKRLVVPREWHGCLDNNNAQYEALWGNRFYGKGYQLLCFTSADCDIIHPLHLVIADGLPHQLSEANMARLKEWGQGVANHRQKVRARQEAKEAKKWARFYP